jgi:hypothetical protein
MKKIIPLCLVLVFGLAASALADTYECVRPDKTVVCTVKTKSNDPSVVCNHDCKSCNLVCVAVKKVVKRGKEAVFGPESGSSLTPAGSDPANTAGQVIEKGLAQ